MFFFSGCAGFGIFGNEEVNRGMKAFTDNAASETSYWDNTINDIKSTVRNTVKMVHFCAAIFIGVSASFWPLMAS